MSLHEGLSEIAFSSMHIVEPEIFNYMNEGIYSMIDSVSETCPRSQNLYFET